MSTTTMPTISGTSRSDTAALAARGAVGEMVAGAAMKMFAMVICQNDAGDATHAAASAKLSR